MSKISSLRLEALKLFDIAIQAANPEKALINFLDKSDILKQSEGDIHLFAVGKAAVPMLNQLLSCLPANRIASQMGVTNYENLPDDCACDIFGAGHPVPDKNGFKAAQLMAARLSRVGENDLVLLLLSGGGSALLPLPVEPIDLSEKMMVTDSLLKSGADIREINTVRRGLSQMKGGGLISLSNAQKHVAFILSDVPGDVLEDIASGPTVIGSTNYADARHILKKYKLWDELPKSVKIVLNKTDEQVSINKQVENILIGSNRMSIEAIKTYLDMPRVKILSEWLGGSVEDAASLFLAEIQKFRPEDGPCAVICGGETYVEVSGTGKGGRNQEMALRIALSMEGIKTDCNWVFLSAGTDGRDGPCDAAGGLVDPDSIQRIRQANLDPITRLANNDSYPALDASGDLVITGGTGTNVADVQILLMVPN